MFDGYSHASSRNLFDSRSLRGMCEYTLLNHEDKIIFEDGNKRSRDANLSSSRRENILWGA